MHPSCDSLYRTTHCVLCRCSDPCLLPGISDDFNGILPPFLQLAPLMERTVKNSEFLRNHDFPERLSSCCVPLLRGWRVASPRVLRISVGVAGHAPGSQFACHLADLATWQTRRRMAAVCPISQLFCACHHQRHIQCASFTSRANFPNSETHICGRLHNGATGSNLLVFIS